MQRELVCLLAQQTECDNMTRTVNKLRLQLACAPSTLWNNLRVLKENGIVEGGSSKEKGRVVRLTQPGRILVEEIQKQREVRETQEKDCICGSKDGKNQ